MFTNLWKMRQNFANFKNWNLLSHPSSFEDRAKNVESFPRFVETRTIEMKIKQSIQGGTLTALRLISLRIASHRAERRKRSRRRDRRPRGRRSRRRWGWSCWWRRWDFFYNSVWSRTVWRKGKAYLLPYKRPTQWTHRPIQSWWKK